MSKLFRLPNYPTLALTPLVTMNSVACCVLKRRGNRMANVWWRL
jgi:hypothetical protein